MQPDRRAQLSRRAAHGIAGLQQRRAAVGRVVAVDVHLRRHLRHHIQARSVRAEYAMTDALSGQARNVLPAVLCQPARFLVEAVADQPVQPQIGDVDVNFVGCRQDLMRMRAFLPPHVRAAAAVPQHTGRRPQRMILLDRKDRDASAGVVCGKKPLFVVPQTHKAGVRAAGRLTAEQAQPRAALLHRIGRDRRAGDAAKFLQLAHAVEKASIGAHRQVRRIRRGRQHRAARYPPGHRIHGAHTDALASAGHGLAGAHPDRLRVAAGINCPVLHINLSRPFPAAQP